MKRFYFHGDLIVGNSYKIEGIEHNHIKNVMRLNIGEEIILVCGDDYDYYAKIIDMSKGTTNVYIEKKEVNANNPKSDITVFQALVKSDNMSLIIQKLTELGVKNFVPFESSFITSKEKSGKTEKLQEISNQSIKQCKRSIPMNVSKTLSFSDMLKQLQVFDLIVFANECEKTVNLKDLNINPNMKIAIIIGSEGGFSEDEISKLVNAGAKSVTLGKRILRAETASIALSSVIMFLVGEWNYD